MEEVRAFEKWVDEKWPDEAERQRFAWALPAVRQHCHWGAGKEVSRAEFEEALSEVMDIPLGGGEPPAAK